jgi:HEAT repeat protein
MLIAYLPDSRGVIGLGVLGSRRAEPRLKALFETEQAARLADPEWYPFGLIDLARALWLIDRDPRWPAAIIPVLTSAADPIQREMAAEALCDVNDPATIAALRGALDDSEPLVRYHAGRGLLIIYRALSDTALPPVDPGHMLYRVMSNDLGKREGGKRDILATIAGC